MKAIEITPMPTNGNTRHYNVVLRTSKGKYTLITSNKALIEDAQAERQAINQLERLTRTIGVYVPNDRKPIKRVLMPILAVLAIYLCCYPTNCNTLQIWGYFAGLMAFIGLGVIIYKYSK